MVARSGKNSGRCSSRAMEFNREDLNSRDKKGNSLDRGNSIQSGVEAGKTHGKFGERQVIQSDGP